MIFLLNYRYTVGTREEKVNGSVCRVYSKLGTFFEGVSQYFPSRLLAYKVLMKPVKYNTVEVTAEVPL